MDLYIFCLLLGGAGLLAMAALGAGHLGGHGSGHAGQNGVGHGGNGHAGHAGDAHGTDAGSLAHPGPLGHATSHSTAHSAYGAARTQSSRGARGQTSGSAVRSMLLSLMSPRVLFSLLVGFGGIGWLLDGILGGWVLLLAALLGGVAFERGLIRPVWNFLFRFASNPAETLEGQLASLATAASGFDANGHGVVAIEVNGEIVQCLGTLRDDDRALGIRVHTGDQLRVESVDAARNRCTVSYVGPAHLAEPT